MKLFIALFLSIFTVSILTVGCSNGKSENKQKSNEETVNSDVSEEGNTEIGDELMNSNEGELIMEEKVLTKEERQKLNTFFSNFSEIGMDAFDQSTITDNEMIMFGVFHNKINNPKRFEKTVENRIKIKKEYVEESIEKYLNKKVTKHASQDWIEFNNGYYTIDNSDGEAYIFTQVGEVYILDENYFFAYLDIYVADAGWTGDYQADPSTWDKEDAPEYYETMTAVYYVKDGRYILEEYLYPY